MKEFKKYDNTMRVKIGNIEYEGEPSYFEVMAGKSAEIIKNTGAKIASGEASKEVIDNATSELISIVDNFFGENSVNKMLEKENILFHDMCDIFVYIQKAVLQFEAEKTALYKQYD